MSWGSAFSDAWNAATDVAKKVAKAVADTAKAAYDYLAQKVKKTVTGIIGQIVETAKKAYNAIDDMFTDDPAGNPTKPCPNENNDDENADDDEPPNEEDDFNIVSIAWLNGGDEITIGDCDQYVNLPRDAKWLADSGIPNVDRLGIQPRFLVTFDKPVSAGFQWRLVKQSGGSPDYTSGEEGRNGNFTAFSDQWQSGSVSDGKAIMADTAKLVAGGGYKFQLEAKDDKGKIVKSGIISTKRLFWYVELPMRNLANALNSTATLDSEFGTHHMVLKQMADLQVPLQENIGSSADSSTLSSNVSSAVSASATTAAKAPYLLRIVYTDHLAVKNSNQRQLKTGVEVGPSKPATEIAVTAPGLRSPNTVAGRALWNDLVTGEGWFVSARYQADGSTDWVDIPEAKVSAVHRTGYAASNCNKVSVDVTGLPAGRGKIEVYVDVVDRMRAGLALGGAANICVCTIAWWNAQSNAEQVCTVIHEMGHKVQMVAEGAGTSGIQPDRVATQYSGRGHVGSHCRNGCAAGQANYATTANANASTCVMFGTVNGRSAFCGNCAPAMKKVDIGAGF